MFCSFFWKKFESVSRSHVVTFQGQNHVIAVMSLLSGHQVSAACRLAQESRDHRLALLIAQAAGANFPRKLLAQQLHNWGDQRVMTPCYRKMTFLFLVSSFTF